MAFPIRHSGFRSLENEKPIGVEKNDYTKGLSGILQNKIKTKRSKYGKSKRGR